MSEQPFIIFLKGISLDDYKNIEDEFNERLLENVSQVDPYHTDKVCYDNIEPIFTSIKKWKPRCNLHCWNCNFTFSTTPVFIPLSIRTSDKDDWNISVHGNFCSFPCAARHITDFLSPDLQDNLSKLYDIFYGKRVLKIPVAPRRHVMTKYGGYLSDEEYLTNIKRLTLNITDSNIIQKEYIGVKMEQELDIIDEKEDFELGNRLWDLGK